MLLMTLMLATALTAVSPDGRTEIRLEAADGALRYSVLRDGKTLLNPADISLSVRGKQFLAEVVSDEPFELKGELETPLYKKRAISLAAKGRRIALKGGYGIELVARDDGVANGAIAQYGVYDLVDDRFYPNIGTRVFLASDATECGKLGAEAPKPLRPRRSVTAGELVEQGGVKTMPLFFDNPGCAQRLFMAWGTQDGGATTNTVDDWVYLVAL